MKAIYCLIALWVLPAVVLAQGFVFPKFDKPVSSADGLVLTGWHVKDSVSGDMNGDGRADMAVVLEYADSVREIREDSVKQDRPRILLILFRDTASDYYRPVCQNNTFILRAEEGWMERDAYDAMTIGNGVLSVDFVYMRVTDTYKFRYQKGDFYLIGATTEQHWANAMDIYDVNLSTGRSEHTWMDPDSHKEHKEWKVLKGKKGIKLREIHEPSSLDIF